MTITDVCTTRVERLRELMAEWGVDAVLLRNNPDLRWLTGAERTFDDEVAHTAVITADHLWLHTDSRYYNTFCERLGENRIWDIDMEIIDPAEWAARRVREAHARVVAVEDTCELGFYDAFHAACDRLTLGCLTPRLHADICDLRMVKDAEELELMRAAQKVTDAGFDHLCGWLRPGLTEQEVRVELENYMLSHGADALSFGTIVATGPNGANPHAQPGERVLERGHLVVIDYGAGYHDYHSDMTRTVAIGQIDEESRRVYDVVRRAHEEAAAAIRPGLRGCDIHQVAVNVITEAGYGDYFLHGLGHGVGLEIHERPNLARSWDRPLPEGSVVTVEPGIYLPGRLGVRLEDFGVITSSGFEPFTQSTHELVVING